MKRTRYESRYAKLQEAWDPTNMSSFAETDKSKDASALAALLKKEFKPVTADTAKKFWAYVQQKKLKADLTMYYHNDDGYTLATHFFHVLLYGATLAVDLDGDGNPLRTYQYIGGPTGRADFKRIKKLYTW